MIRNEFFRRVITKCAASLLARAAASRKFRSRGSFSKYSTRHGAQSVSNSLFGNSSVAMIAAYLKQLSRQDATQILGSACVSFRACGSDRVLMITIFEVI